MEKITPSKDTQNLLCIYAWSGDEDSIKNWLHFKRKRVRLVARVMRRARHASIDKIFWNTTVLDYRYRR